MKEKNTGETYEESSCILLIWKSFLDTLHTGWQVDGGVLAGFEFATEAPLSNSMVSFSFIVAKSDILSLSFNY